MQAVDEAASRAAVGCLGAELNIWDLQTQQRTYLGKASKPNRMGELWIEKCEKSLTFFCDTRKFHVTTVTKSMTISCLHLQGWWMKHLI